MDRIRRNNPILNVPAILDIPNTVNRVLSRGIIRGDELFRKDDRYCSCFEIALMELLYILYVRHRYPKHTRNDDEENDNATRYVILLSSTVLDRRARSNGREERQRETIKSSMARILLQRMYICSPRSSCPREKRFTARYPVCSDVISIFF